LHIQQPHNKTRKFNCVLHAHSQFLCSLEHLKLSTPSQPHTFWSTAIRRDIRAVLYFCSCELRWRSVECVSFHCFNALPDIFAVMNCSVLGYRWQLSAWFNYFLPTGHFTKTWQLAGLFQQNDVLLQPLRWSCVDCVIHHERDVREEQKYVCVERASNNKRDCDVVTLPILTCERLNIMTSVREERLRRMISIVTCCHGAKLCAHATRDFRSHQYESTDSQDIKSKRENRWVRWAYHWNYYTISINNLLQISISSRPVVEDSLTLSFLNNTIMLVLASYYGTAFRLPFDFCFQIWLTSS